ncbi:MAG: PaaX family transcriptional regulator C-terminal domain-containing protein [Arenibacterium sp.]
MTDPITPLVAALHAQGRLRVWSLIITVFGDLVQHRGGEISTTRLGHLLDRAGVERGAVRTALSRLGRDGWVTSTRKGRSSLYRLSAEGEERFAPATSRIYAAPLPTGVRNWRVLVHLQDNGLQQVALRPLSEDDEESDLRLSGALEHVSDAYRESLLDPGHRRALTLLADDLKTLTNADIQEPLDAATARMLLIHRWRRIVLRFDDIFPDLMPEDAPLADPRRAVAQAYHRLTPATDAWLDRADGELSAMPMPSRCLAPRFVSSDEA